MGVLRLRFRRESKPIKNRRARLPERVENAIGGQASIKSSGNIVFQGEKELNTHQTNDKMTGARKLPRFGGISHAWGQRYCLNILLENRSVPQEATTKSEGRKPWEAAMVRAWCNS